jgi:phage recombination protein Bet
MEENKEMLPRVVNFDDPKMVKILKATVAQGATDEEFALFAELCKSTGLNPFKREVWFIKTKGYTKRDGTVTEPKLQVMTGINGYLAIANKHPMFDGMETEVSRDEKTHKPIRSITKVYRKDRKFPHIAEAYFDEYYQPTYSGKPGIWDLKPGIMIAKVSKSIALREAFAQELGGLYTEEEMPAEYGKDAVDVTPDKPAPKALGCLSADELTPTQEQLEARTNKAMKEGRAYQYDLTRIAAACQNQNDKRKLFGLLRAKGIVTSPDNKTGFTFDAVLELAEYLKVEAVPQDDDNPDWMDELPHATTPEQVVSEEEAHKKLDAMMKSKKQAASVIERKVA